jgi:glycine/D-amino acid oxidase-like deaminating enzyme
MDALVIGGGFFGCETALELRRLGFEHVTLAEREPALMRRASYVNQARVHGGYHYPRDYATAVRSRESIEAFTAEYPETVVPDIESYYAIARGSRVSADQFEAFCARIGAYCQPADADIENLFEEGMIERSFSVKEAAFDTSRLSERLWIELSRASVDVRCATDATIVEIGDETVTVDLAGTRHGPRFVFNCTYAALETVGVPIRSRIKKELAELVLITPPAQLAGRSITVMDGPFFSVMPFPALGQYSLSHVRYTPHVSSSEADAGAILPTKSNATEMVRDAARYLPCLAQAQVSGSLFDIKAVLLSSEDTDARPILVERSEGAGNVLSILGAKIDNIYDVRAYLRSQDWS